MAKKSDENKLRTPEFWIFIVFFLIFLAPFLWQWQISLIISISVFHIHFLQTLQVQQLYLDKEKEFGSIDVGKLADILIVDRDPTEDVKNLRRISAVVKDGTLIDRSRLDIPVNSKANTS
jgi:hypothetical protein